MFLRSILPECLTGKMPKMRSFRCIRLGYLRVSKKKYRQVQPTYRTLGRLLCTQYYIILDDTGAMYPETRR